MRNVLLIVRREFLERVRTRSFVLSTLLFPLFMAALIFIPSLMKSGGGERTLVLVDQSPAGIGQSVAQAITSFSLAFEDGRSGDSARERLIRSTIGFQRSASLAG